MIHSIYMYILYMMCVAMEMSMLFNTVLYICFNMMAMSILFNTETLAKGERLQRRSEKNHLIDKHNS